MVERALVPFSWGLIPSEELTPPVLNPRQQKELLDIIRMYGVSITDRGVVKRISEVARDAILRALGEKGQVLPASKDRLKPLFKRGLEIREDLRTKAETYLTLSLRNQNTYSDLVGPLALPASLISAANTDQRTFALTTDLTGVQQVVMMGEERFALVDPWAKTGLAALPETLRPVRLEQFPTVAERVKIIRNMITSFVFRGDLSPLISVAELKDFVIKAPSFFSEEAKELLLEQMQADTTQKRSYLEALYTQTREPFRLYTAVPADDNPKGIEDFYRRYTRDLLLMHPALEEQQIIINPEKVSEGIPSLWDGGRVVGECKLPKPELLSQALRQASARGAKYVEDRLKRGLGVLEWFYTQTRAQEQKIRHTEQRLKDREDLLGNLEDPNFLLPNEGNLIIYKTQRKTRNRLTASRTRIRYISKTITESQAAQRQAEGYEEFLNEKYGNYWPDLVPMPKDLWLEKLSKDVNHAKALESNRNAQLIMIENFLSLDFIWARANTPISGRLTGNEAKTVVQDQLNKTPPGVTFEENILEELRNYLELHYVWEKHLKYGPSAFRKYYDFLKKTRDLVSLRRTLRKTPERFWTNFVNQSLVLRRQVLESVLAIIEGREKAALELEQAQARLAAYEKNPDSEPEYWNREDAQGYLLSTRAARLPDLTGFPQEELLKTVQQMEKVLYGIYLTDLPTRIPVKETFIQSILLKRDAATKAIAKKEASGKRAGIVRLRRTRDSLTQLLDLIDHPLIPFPEGAGFKRADFVEILRKRVILANVTLSQEEEEKIGRSVEEVYEKMMRNTFKSRLKWEINSRKQDLEALKGRDLQSELVKKLRNLNLVLAV